MATKKIMGWEVVTRWINNGATPTRNLRIYFHVEVLDRPIPGDYEFATEDVEFTPVFLGPHSETGSLPVPISLSDTIAVRDGTKHLYTWGWAEYDDIFPGTPRHRTEFCHKWTINGDPATGEIFPRYESHNTHNGTDEECLKPLQTASPKGRAGNFPHA